MNSNHIIRFADLAQQISLDPNLKSGFIVDSNILFAASYELDLFHEETIKVLNLFNLLS